MASFRDIGQAFNNLSRPDGGSLLATAASSLLPQGATSRITGLLNSPAADKIKNGVSSSLKGAADLSKGGTQLTSVIPNPLEKFASYAPMWTMACLEKNQFNNPASYRNSPKELKHVVFASGGRFDAQRAATAYGAPEYYVNNFVMQTAIAATGKTGNSNAFKFTWDIIEPHSMGLLLQSLQNAAQKAGYANYLNNAPFVLRLDFMGYDEEGRIMTSVKPKFWTMKLTKVTFSVNENGSVYKCEAVPYNHTGFSDSVNTAYADVKLVCSRSGPNAGTVKDLLVSGENSLCKFLNDLEEKMLTDQKISVKDVYVIEFPEKSDEFLNAAEIPGVTRKATTDPKGTSDKLTIAGKGNVAVSTDFGKNEIGLSDFGFDRTSGGAFPFEKYGDKVDPKTGIVNRDQMSIDPKRRTFQFTQAQRLTAIINQVILSSTYSKKALDPKNLVNGFIKWWRIDVQIQMLDMDYEVGDYAMKFIYRVVPFLVHHSIFSPPTAQPIGYKELEKQIVKQYNYIYTGQNVDVLKFDIQIDNLFFTASSASSEANNSRVSNQDQKGVAPNPGKTVTTTLGSAPAAQLATLGRARVKKDPSLLSKPKGGNTDKTTEQVVAENFHKAFTSAGSGDLVKVSLEILGDPYWMVDSGISNYFARQSSTSRLLTEDGTMNYEGGDVFIYLTFRTPADIDEATGLYQWPTAGKESPFSGIYRVTQCENTFNDGVFKQKLTCIRQVGQSQDFQDKNPNVIANLKNDKTKAIAVTIGAEQKPKTDPTQESKPTPDIAPAKLTKSQQEWLGGADPNDPYIRARMPKPLPSETNPTGGQ